MWLSGLVLASDFHLMGHEFDSSLSSSNCGQVLYTRVYVTKP